MAMTGPAIIQLKLLQYLRRLVPVVLCTVLGFQLAAQPELPIRYMGIENGLSNNSVTRIYQDRYGFIWVGTYDGLNRYDGYSFKVFRHRLNDTSTLINNRVAAIAEDQENRLWIGTKKGISTYSNITHRFSPAYYQPIAGQKGGKQLIDMPANELMADDKGNVFIGSSGKGLMMYQKASGTIVQVPFVTADGKKEYNYQIQGVRQQKDGTVWVFVNGHGIGVYDYKQHCVIIKSTYIGYCGTMEIAGNGHLWMSSGSYIFEYNPNENSYINRGLASAGRENVSCILPDEDNGVWVGTDGGGIVALQNGENPVFKPLVSQASLAKPNSTAISDLFEDRQGNKWIGTLRGGLNCISNSKRPFASLTHEPISSNSLAGNFVSAFEQDNDGRLWVGTDGNGISIWDRKQNKFTSLNHDNSGLANNLVTFIKQTMDGQMWVATYGGGVDLYDSKTGRFSNYGLINHEARLNESNAWLLYEDKNNALWAGSITGSLYRFNPQANNFEIFDNKLSDILSLAEDSEGNLWAGNFESLIKIDRVNKRHEFYPAENPVRVIHQDKTGDLWVGTEGSGLLLLDKKAKKFKAFTEEDGLSNNSVLNMLEDRNGQLWLSTFNGLSRLNTETKQFKNFFQSDGLQSNQFNYNAAYAAPSGEFFFGGLKGMDFFYPDSVALSYSPSNLLVTGLRIDNVPLSQNNRFTEGKVLYTLDDLTLPYEKAVLSVDFASPEFTTPDQISYAYYLEGWDKGWNYSGKVRTANYSRLNEGHYKLHIKATNAGGIWGNEEKVILITILPPWYRTWWAILLYCGIAVGLIALYITYKNKQSRLAYEVKLAHLNAERETELNNKKLDFFTNIAHEFRTPITLIINPIKDFLYKPGAEAGPAEMKMVYRNSRRLLSLVDQLLLFKKAESGIDDLRVVKLNLTHVCREVFLCFTQQAKSQQIDYRFESPAEDIEAYADREKLEIAIFNLISNAMKFTPPNGRIWVRLDETNSRVGLSVQDTGCGIPEEIGAKLFERFYQSKHSGAPLKAGFGIGLFLAKSFVDAHKGQLDYTTKLNEGTTFSVSLQKGCAHFAASQIAQLPAQKSLMLAELNEENDETPLAETEAIVQPTRDASMDTLITSGHTILLVDDNEGIRQYLTQVFKDNFTLHEASNGKEGLAMAKQYMPDIIISDIVMNEMTGIEFCAAVKEDPALSHIQVILLTGSSSAEIKLKGVECGADDYITKPFERELLLARVASLLKSRNNLQKYFYNEITLRKNDLTISEEYKVFLNRCIDTVETHIERDDFSIKLFAKEMGMSHSNLYKRVKQVSGQSISSFIRFIRLRKAAELLISTDCNVNEAAFQVGISDGKYFRAQFVKLFGMVPSEYKKKYHQAFQKNYKVHEKAIRTRPVVEG
jgi:signal transduction histidine kinase/ligand-binding sensor domain-containing protein/DNA-binding response OmpR family regulator